MPLLNYVSCFKASLPRVDEHPLLRKRSGENWEEHRHAPLTQMSFYSHMSDNVISFSYKGLPVFIQPVVDYTEVVEQLNRGLAQAAVTAIMVGELPADIRTQEQVERYLPDDLLVLLSLGTGTEVSTSGVEIYDATGHLLSWYNPMLPNPIYRRHRELVHELLDQGMSRLLDLGARSNQFNTTTLRVVAPLLIRSSYEDDTVEDRLGLLFRAFDCLCKLSGIPDQVTVESRLSTSQREEFNRIIRDAGRKIRRIGSSVDDNDVAKVFEQAAQGVSKAKQVSRGLGVRIIELTQLEGVNDSRVMDGYVFRQEGEPKRNWSALISCFRGIVMHEGYFNLMRHPEAHDATYVLLDHLHDLLLRILLKRLNFDGKYQPSMIRATAAFELDWVKPETHFTKLGYPK